MNRPLFIGRCMATLNRPQRSFPPSFRSLSAARPKSRLGKDRKKRTPITAVSTKLAGKNEDGLAPTNEVKEGQISKKRMTKRSTVREKQSSEKSIDATDHPVLIPGGLPGGEGRSNAEAAQQASPFFHSRSHQFGGGGSYRLTQVLPTVDGSSLLSPKQYIKKSATPGGVVTISGADGARRLLRGRQKLLNVLRKELLDRPRHKRNPPRPYALIGHGVPSQLLQDHINMADALLACNDNAAKCSFTNFHGDLSFSWMRVRSRKGENTACPWPPPIDQRRPFDWDHRMKLYMTVMNRLASNLGMALRRDSPSASPTMSDAGDDDFVTVIDPLAPTSPRYWSVEIVRDLAYPPHLIPEQVDAGPLSPVVEWTPREGISAPGHVCIRLQGTPANETSTATSSLRRKKKKAPVTLVFDACFRNIAPVT